MGHHRKVIIYDNHQESHLAINEDGAISEDGRPSSIGVIIHDSNGHVTAAMSKGLPAQFPVESIAIAIGFLIDQELKVSKVIVESNALSIIQSVNAKDTAGALGHIFQRILNPLHSFSSWKFQHLKREHNRAAHDLAALARSSETAQVWKGVTPPMLQNLLYRHPP